MKAKKVFPFLILVAMLLPLIASSQGANTLTWDYGTDGSDVLCSATKTQDCIQSFDVFYESAPAVLTKAITVQFNVCTPIAIGWTCTIPTPSVTGRKYKANIWSVAAVTSDGISSLNSNTVTKQTAPRPPVAAR